MSSVDNRVVRMSFDNAQFENGIKTSNKSLETLKQGLNLDEAAKKLSNLNNVGKNFSLAGIESGVDNISNKFTALGIVGVTALVNITNSAINAGKQLVSSLTIDPISDGYADYGRKITSIQTIMNATGKSIKDVEPYFNSLDEYADKTIYNLDDMTSAMAKFTNAGVDLDKSVPAIKGIANMVAVAGQDAGAAQIAFYNLSQSIAGGFLTTMDYKSLNLANVATKEWKDNMINGAIAAGTLKDAGNGMYQIKGAGEAVTGAALFNEELSKGWATTNVLLDVLGQYGDTNTKIGAKAQAAAQDVKSFSMMMDTLKASVGTTWTDTFEILVGNLEEAKALFTPLTNAISGFIGVTADARNGLLKGWKELGGRDATIQSLVNAFNGLMGILKPIGEAFREIFPPITSEQLANFSKGILDLTSKFKIGEETATKIKDSFKGVFAVFDIGKQFVIELGKAIFEIVGYLLPAGDGFLSCTSSIGNFLVYLDQTIKSSNLFANVLGKVVNAIKFVIDASRVATQFIIGLFKGFDNVDLSGITAMSDHIKACFEPMTGLGVKIQEVFTTVKEFLSNNVLPVLSKIGDTIKSVFSDISSSISESFSGTGSLVGILNGGLFVAIIVGIKKLVKAITSIFSGPGDILGSVKDVIGGVQDSLDTFQNTLKAGMLTKIAIAIAILAGSILVLSLINPERLGSSMAAITGLFIELFGSLAAFQKIVGNRTLKSINKMAFTMILLGVAIDILTIAMTKLAKLDWEGIGKGLTGIGGLMIIITASSKTLSNGSGDLLKGAIGLIAFGLAINILSIALKKISDMSLESIATGLGTIALIIAEVALFSKVTGSNKNLVSTSIGLTILAVSMIIFSKAIEKLGSLPIEVIGKGLITMAVALIIISAAFKILPKDIIGQSVGLVIMAASLLILSQALSSMGGMSWEQIAKGLVTLAGSLLIIGVTMNFMKTALPGAAAMLVMAAALAILTPCLITLGNMSLADIGTSLLTLAATFAIFGVAGLVLAPLTPVILALAASMALFGVGCLAVGTAMLVFATGLTVLTAVGAAGTAVLVTLVTSIIGLIPMALSSIAQGLVEFAKAIGEKASVIGEAFMSLLLSIIDSIVQTTKPIIDCLMGLLTTMLTTIITVIPQLVDAGVQIILGFLKGIADNIAKVVAAGIDIIIQFMSGISSKIPDIIDTAFKIIISFINGLADAINNNTEAIGNACVNLVDAIVNGITSLNSKFVDAGINAVKGFIKGLASAPGKIIDAGIDMGKSALDALTGALDEHSPSKATEQAGIYAGEGLVMGMNKMNGKVSNAGYNMGDRVLSSMSKAISGISDIVNNIDTQPTIRPVMDLSDVVSGVGTMNSMFNKNQGITVSSANDKTSAINNRMLANNIQNGVKESTTPNNLKDNSNISSKPVALQLVLQNGTAIAEYLVNDLDGLFGSKNQISGRMVGI